MRPKAPATVITALNDEELRRFTSLTEVSRCLVYLSVIVPAIFFLLDNGFDVALVITYWRNEQKWEAFFTVLVLIFAGLVTSIYYWFNEEWIDTVQDLRVENKQNAQPSPQYHQAQCDDIEFQDLRLNRSSGLLENCDNTPNSKPRASTSQTTTSPDPRLDIISSPEPDVVILTGNKRPTWRLVRQWTRYSLLSPIFRAYYLVTKLGSSIDQIENSKRRPLSEAELDAVVMIRDSQINQACFNMIETNFEALPQTLLQIYLAVHLKLTFKFDNWADAIIYGTIVWSIFSAAISATSYSAAYHLHLKIARVKDILYFGGENKLKGLFPISWFTLIATFFFNLVVIIGRIYGLANILVAWGVFALLGFVVILYIIQYFWLEICQDQRMFYENPTRGVTTPCSNLVDRWKNIFCFHQILPSLKSIFTYHMIFLFLFFAFCRIFTAIYGQPAQFLTQNVQNNETNFSGFDNGTNLNISDIDGTKNFSDINSRLKFSPRTDLDAENKSCDFNVFPKTCNLSHMILSENGVMIYWIISLFISLIYLRIRKTRDKILLEKYFPILKGIDMWTRLTDGENLAGASIERKRALCLCIMAKDHDARQILGDKCPCCYNASKRETDIAKTLNGKISMLWAFYTEGYKFDWLREIKESNQRRIMRVHWDRMKIVKGTNTSALGVYNNYVQKLNEMIDPLFEDQTSMSVIDLQFFMYFYDNFEISLSRSNSFRLGKMDILLGGQNLKKNKFAGICICP